MDININEADTKSVWDILGAPLLNGNKVWDLTASSWFIRLTFSKMTSIDFAVSSCPERESVTTHVKVPESETELLNIWKVSSDWGSHFCRQDFNVHQTRLTLSWDTVVPSLLSTSTLNFLCPPSPASSTCSSWATTSASVLSSSCLSQMMMTDRLEVGETTEQESSTVSPAQPVTWLTRLMSCDPANYDHQFYSIFCKLGLSVYLTGRYPSIVGVVMPDIKLEI